MSNQTNNGIQRLDFSRIQTAIGIPNLIEIQRQSYNQLMQMDLLSEERRDTEGLQAVFKSVFPITDYRNSAQLDFVSYLMGIWQCKCGQLEGLEHLRSQCKKCKAVIRLNPFMSDEVLCNECGMMNKNALHLCPNCSEPVGLKLKYDVLECQERGMTYAIPLKVKFRLTVFDLDEASGKRSVRDIKEEEVYFGEVPLMTDNGTFIINGTERVIVSQLHRSPGVYFEKPSVHGYLGKIIPNRGAWVEFEYDAKNVLYVRIDKKRKILGSVFLRALGLPIKADLESIKENDEAIKNTILTASYTDEEILRLFYKTQRIRVRDGSLYWQLDHQENTSTAVPKFTDLKAPEDIVNPKTGDVIVRSGRKISTHAYREMLKAKVKEVEISIGDLEANCFVADIVDADGEVCAEANAQATPQAISTLIANNIREFEVFYPDRDEVGQVLSTTLKKDSAKSPAEALVEIYRKMRPGDPPTVLSAWRLFESMFFDSRKFDFSRVGRLKFNIKVGYPQHHRIDDLTLSPQDFFDVVRYLLRLHRGFGEVDDRDHLGNRRVRAVGELLENQFRVGLVRMERAIKEKMSVHAELQTAMPRDLVNAKPVIAALKEFFGSSQLSQFMDQTNPLSEITHKRRLSALGPGGLSRERAGFEVRDVHPTHYGRICPIETPEGPNIGLISSLACYARIDEFGFIQAPYRKVEDGRVIDYVRILSPGDTPFKLNEHVPQEKVEKVNRRLRNDDQQPAEYEPYPFYLTAWEEAQYVIGQANIELDEQGHLVRDRVAVRKAGEFTIAPREEVQFLDISPKQLVSVAASLIPFLEHDDANRALMGSNMQRQSVPLLKPEAPIVGTGMEDVVARDSGAVVLARRDGIVDKVDSERIIIRTDQESGGSLSREVTADIYQLIKFKRSNQNTCINQKPIVQVGQRVKKGHVIADGPCTDQGELALGRNVLVAFMPWRGYNYEDAILVSEKLVKEDAYTSVHIEELEIEARDTKLGPEDITRDIPNVSEHMLRDLDDAGIVRIGAYVKPGSILVGKVTPKGETQLTPEEKLLRAIFGEKAGDVRDASLKCPPGIEGTVIDVKVFTRRGVNKDARSLAIEQAEEEKLQRNLQDEIRILEEERDKRMREALEGQKLAADLFHNRKKVLNKGDKLTRELLDELEFQTLRKIQVVNPKVDVAAQIKEMETRTHRQVLVLEHFYKERIEKLRRGDELPAGVIKMVKVYIAMKRKLSVGDKMAGRHGNKGVIARILPLEDMPYLEDGTPVEIVLNPLGVPSRMNVGQLLETHLGWAGKALGLHFSSPVFDGATEDSIRDKLSDADLSQSGKVRLSDGMTGEPFQEKVTVGYIYIMKLSHLVDDKIHARSIGPYSLITQQPLGGKAQFGGQRFGEMEVWALEAYGAAYTLQELLTAKSDDVAGRSRIYEGIVNGNIDFEPGVPESFSVLVRELQGLCLDVELIKREEEPDVLDLEGEIAAD